MPKIEVSLYDILKYIGERTRPLKEGEEVFNAGHVILCGVETVETKKIKGLCLQTSSLATQPHEISIEVSKEVKEWHCTCSCKAGLSGVCKHIIATLIYVNRNPELEVISCTDLAQKWGKEKKGVAEIYKALPFKDFCHPRTKKLKTEFRSSLELDKRNFDILSTGVPDSALTRFLNRDPKPMDLEKIDLGDNRNFLPQFELIVNNGAKTNLLQNIRNQIDLEAYSLLPCCQNNLDMLANCDIIEIATKYPQGSSMWAKERQLRLTGSTCYSIFTFQKTEEWENKSKKFFYPKGFTSKFTQHGKKYEKDALECYRTKYGSCILTPGLVVCKLMPWLAFSPDGIIFENNEPFKLLEIKCPYNGKEKPHESFLEACDFIEVSGSKINLKKRQTYYGQVQLGMALLGLKSTVIILYSSFSKSFLEINVELDEIFVTDFIKKITDNFFRHMLHYYCLNKE